MADGANANYGSYDASNAWAVNAAYAIELKVRSKWTHAQAQLHPLLSCLQDGKSNFQVGREVTGRALIIPVVMADQTTAPAGVTDANELTAMTLNSTVGPTQAEYDWAHYRGNYTIRESEKQLLTSGPGVARGRILEAKAEQLIENFKKVLSTAISGSSAGSRSAIMGAYYPLSASNTPGGIDQATYTNWQAQVKSTTGTLTLPILDQQLDGLRRWDSRGTDLMLAAYASGGVNVYGKIRSLLYGSVHVVNDSSERVKAGFNTFLYRGAEVVMDHFSPSGYLGLFNTKSWVFQAYDSPQAQPIHQIQGTDGFHQMYTWWGALACANPKLNGVLTGITG